MYGTAAMPSTESGMSAAEASVAATKAAMAAATAVASSAVLRPHRDREEESERRDGHQATHTDAIISPFFTYGRGFTNSDECAGRPSGGRNQRLPLALLAAAFLAGLAAGFDGLAAGFAGLAVDFAFSGALVLAS